jgi:anti-sigma factor RsiW
MAASSEDHEERLMQAMAYYGNDLSAEEKAEFEAHLATCDECREILEVARAGLPFAEALLTHEPKHTLDEQMARFEAMRAERVRAEAAARRSPRSTTWLRFGLALGAAAAVAALLLLSRGQNLHPGREAFAPQRTLDGGDAGPR